jgi:hypothetical protein
MISQEMLRVPDSIRQKVLTQWLRGISRDMIANNVGKSRGTVSMILRQYREENPDFDTLRTYVVSVKNQGANIKELASLMRLDNRFNELGLDQSQVEVFLDNVAEHCFKKEMTTQEFINNIDEVTRVSRNIKVPIDKLQNFITDKRKELNKLDAEIIFKRFQNDQLLREHNVTKLQLQAFVVYWPFLLKLQALKQILSSMDIEKVVINKDTYSFEGD